MVKGQLVADVLNSQRAERGATWRINAKILSTCRGQRHIVSPRAQLVYKRIFQLLSVICNGQLHCKCYVIIIALSSLCFTVLVLGVAFLYM